MAYATDDTNPHADQLNVAADAEALTQHEVEAFCEAAERLAKSDVTPETEKLVADLVVRERALRNTIEDAGKVEKRPHLDAQNRINARVNGHLAKLATALAAPKEKLRKYLLAKEAERVEQERIAREAAERAEAARRALAAESEAATPFERFRAKPAIEAAEVEVAEAARVADTIAETKTRVQSYSGGGVGLRSTKAVKLVDAALLVAHFADDPDVIEAAMKRARAVAKGDKYRKTIPGVIFEDVKTVQ